ncbi:hypothetical protein V7S57_02505 [Caulobacter sp. CCNWLY153]|uniref:hypothetical protein n=1 Tax=unclassified Caulobacter TaxID=2648921 RepID=UPI002FF30358
MEERHRILSGVLAACVVALWDGQRLLAVLLSEPPPTRRRALRETFNTGISSALAVIVGGLSYDWAGAFINQLVEKHLGVNPNVSPIVAALVIAVVIARIGPSLLRRVESVFGKTGEVTP